MDNVLPARAAGALLPPAPAVQVTRYVYVQMRGRAHEPVHAFPGKAHCEDALTIGSAIECQVTAGIASGGGTLPGWVAIAAADGHGEPAATDAAAGALAAVQLFQAWPEQTTRHLIRTWQRFVTQHRRPTADELASFGTTFGCVAPAPNGGLLSYRIGDILLCTLPPADQEPSWIFAPPRPGVHATHSLGDTVPHVDAHALITPMSCLLASDGIITHPNDPGRVAREWADLLRWALDDPSARHAEVAHIIATDVHPDDDLTVVAVRYTGEPHVPHFSPDEACAVADVPYGEATSAAAVCHPGPCGTDGGGSNDQDTRKT